MCIFYSQTLDKYYVGHTENFEIRLAQHNRGDSTYTAKAGDWILCYKENFQDRASAYKRERRSRKRRAGNTLNG